MLAEHAIPRHGTIGKASGDGQGFSSNSWAGKTLQEKIDKGCPHRTGEEVNECDAPPFQAFLLPTPHQSDLQLDEGPAQQYRRLSERLQSTVFPEFVSAPSLHISFSSPTSCRGTVGLAARSWGHPSVPTAPQSPAQQAEPGASNRIHLQSLTHGVREQLQGRREGRDRDTTTAQLQSPSRAGMSCCVCLLGASRGWAARRETGEETRTPQGRARGP